MELIFCHKNIDYIVDGDDDEGDAVKIICKNNNIYIALKYYNLYIGYI